MGKDDFKLPEEEPYSLQKLRKLIFTLNASEKNIFKRYVRNYSEKNNKEAVYIQLFECINDCLLEVARTYTSAVAPAKAAEYFDGMFYLKFKNRFALRRFAKASELGSKANYVYDKILESLRSYNPNDSIRRELIARLSDIQLLYQKELYEECMAMLEQTKKRAAEIDALPFLLDLYGTERRIRARSREIKHLKIIRQIGEAEQRCLQNLQAVTSSFDLYQEALLAQRNRQSVEDDIIVKTKINQHVSFLTDPQSAESPVFDLKFNYHSILANLINMAMATPSPFLDFIENQNLTNVVAHLREIVMLFESRPQRIQEDPSRFRDNLMNYLSYSLNAGEVVDMKKYEDYLTADVEPSDPEFLRNATYLTVLTYIRKKDFLHAVQFLQSRRILELIQQYGHQISVSRRQVLYYLGGIIYFIREEFKTAQKWFAPNLEEQELQGLADAVTTSALCHLLTQFELGETDSHKYKQTLLNPLARQLEKTGQINRPFEHTLVETLKKILKSSIKDKGLPTLAAQLHTELHQKMQEQQYQGPLDLSLGWLESKATGKPLRYTLDKYI